MSRSDRRAEKAREWEAQQEAEAIAYAERRRDLYFVPDHARDAYLELEDCSTPATAKAVLELWEALNGGSS